MLKLRGSFFVLARAGEIFASKEKRLDDGDILRRGDVVLFRGSTRLDWTTWGQADRVEVRFWSSKRDSVMTRVRAKPPLSLRDAGGAVELVIELLSLCMLLLFHAPLAAFGSVRGNWSVWTQAWATTYVLNFVRIGGATFLSTGGGRGVC